jgi:phenylpropionate dioxygenase-like ring-hydroxylating dioxygenase large terminal subunit
MFMRNCWQVAAFGREVVAGQLFPRKICGDAVVFYRAKDGRVVALEDRCAHRYAPLSMGALIGDTLRCMYHGLCYDTDGKCVQIPGQDHVPPKARVRAFPVLERYNFVWVWMADPAWVASEGYHHVKANYKLLNDNLLDLSHETYVHGKTIGHDSVAETPIAIRNDVNAVYVDKEMKNCNPPPFYQYLARVSATDRVDRWQHTVFQPPGYIVIDVGVQPLDAVPGSNRVEGRVIDLITPETAASSHYFWAFARNFRLGEPAVTEFLRENVRRTFDEDKDMLEAQQRNIGERESERGFDVAIRADAGPTQGRRLLASMLEAEARGSIS